MGEQKNCIHCGRVIPEGKRSHAVYCSDKCKAERHRAKHRVQGFSGLENAETPDLYGRAVQSPVPAFAPSQTEVNMLQREIDKLDRSNEELYAENKKLRDKLDSAKDQVRDLQADQRIQRIENERPGGLSGVLTQNPDLIEKCTPLIEVLADKLLSSNPPAGQQIGAIAAGDDETMQRIAEFSHWYGNLEKELRDEVWTLIELVSRMDKPSVKMVTANIKRMVETNKNNQQNATRSTGS
ncbi:MAG: hypothetical protein ACPG43_12570 [Alcanivoracaceae bacterium]